MADQRNSIRPEELETCKKVLTRTNEGKLKWDYSISGQVWSSANGILFSLYLPNAEIADNDRWRRFDVERAVDNNQTILLFTLANPKESVGVALGIRVASSDIAVVLDDLLSVLVAKYSEDTYGQIFQALDNL